MSSNPETGHEVEAPPSRDTATNGDAAALRAMRLRRLESDPTSPNFSWKMTWDEWVDKRQHYQENRANFPPEERAKYVGKTVAWEPDGSAIRAVGEDHHEVWNKILDEDDDPQIYVYEYIPHADDVF